MSKINQIAWDDTVLPFQLARSDIRGRVARLDGVAVGVALRSSAAAPATCGVAMDVPLMVLVAEAPVCQADVMLEPGANRSRQLP